MVETKKQLVNIIHKYLPQCKIYLFGSRARNTHREGADIDLALDAGHEIDFETIVSLKSDIESTTIPQTVDIVDMQSAPEHLKQEIKRDGITWAH